MSSTPTTRGGRHLWQLLPQHARTRDAEEGHHLLALLDAVGGQLDLIRGTLDQRLAEVTAAAVHPVRRLDPADPQRTAQAWVLPYLAELLDVRFTAPTAVGQREEVQRAVRWRKGKGTAHVAEEAAELVLEREVELVEGRTLVATTPRVDTPLLPEASLVATPRLGEDEQWRAHPLESARHPAQPIVTPRVAGRIDTTWPDPAATGTVVPGPHGGGPGRAVATDPLHPRARRRRMPGDDDAPVVVWRHRDPHAAPCFPGTHEDVARRTPDVRTPSTRQGWHHPKTLVAFTAPATGFFPAPPRPADRGAVTFDADGPADPRTPLQGVFLTELTVSAGQLLLSSATVAGDITITAPGTHHLVGVVQTSGRVRTGPGVTLEADGCALRVVEAHAGAAAGAGPDGRGRLPVWPARPGPIDETDALVAVDCLLDEVTAEGRITLDGCTVLGPCGADVVRAADTVFVGPLSIEAPAAASCLRFSRIPSGLPAGVRIHRCTTATPLFQPHLACGAWAATDPAVWGEAGCGVLHPDCPTSITGGADDGGEQGAYHHLHHVLARAAVAARLGDLVTVGTTPVVVPDVRLLVRPPEEAGQ